MARPKPKSDDSLPPLATVATDEGRPRRLSVGLRMTIPVESPFTERWFSIAPSVNLTVDIPDDADVEQAATELYQELTGPYMKLVLSEYRRALRMSEKGAEPVGLELLRRASGVE